MFLKAYTKYIYNIVKNMSKYFLEKNKSFVFAMFVIVLSFLPFVSVGAEFIKGEVVNIIDREEVEFWGEQKIQQEIQVKHLSGTEKGIRTTILPENMTLITEAQKYNMGETVVLQKTTSGYQLREKFRLPYLLGTIILFIGLVFLVSKRQGLFSLLGLFFSILILVKFLVPQIINGRDPLFISLITSILITGISIYLSHGFRKRTHVAVTANLIVLVLSFFLAFLSVYVTKLFGLGTEQAYYIFIGLEGSIDLRGLLLGGIMLGTVGLLDDVTTTQCATIEEIQKVAKQISCLELFKKGMSVGKEHIASMINTLALAYAGAGLPLFLLVAMNEDSPWWVILNSEFVVEEIIRTLVGSTALLLAVPISTALAAKVFSVETIHLNLEK
jgi:uncharacterized membrane protein